LKISSVVCVVNAAVGSSPRPSISSPGITERRAAARLGLVARVGAAADNQRMPYTSGVIVNFTLEAYEA
jgi:hypothetical protein